MFFHWVCSHDERLMRSALALAPYVNSQLPSDRGQMKVLERFYTLGFPEGPPKMVLVLTSPQKFSSRSDGMHRKGQPDTTQNQEVSEPNSTSARPQLTSGLEDVPCFAPGAVRSIVIRRARFVPGLRRILAGMAQLSASSRTLWRCLSTNNGGQALILPDGIVGMQWMTPKWTGRQHCHRMSIPGCLPG
jgi:hypothetical protein